MESPARILVMPDKFKGTLTSDEAARAIVRGLRCAWPRARFTTRTLADGGEGFAAALVRATGGTSRRCASVDASGYPCRAVWGWLGDGRGAVLDLAAASGLAQLPRALRSPLRTSTYGSGLVLRKAIDAGAAKIVIGLGGSATNDGGIGLAAALGWKFLDRRGGEIELNGAGLLQLDRIVAPKPRPRLRIVAACDVDNPLFGRNGAAYRFAAQKGADAAAVRALDRGLRRLARIVERDLGGNVAQVAGAGAAGGAGFGLMAFFGARLESGFEILRREMRLDALLREHDLVVTGEGAFDLTSLSGKAPYRLALHARQMRVPVWGVFGRIDVAVSRLPFARAAALVVRDATVPASLASAKHALRLERAAYELAVRG
ncbi:MAG: glycerate kinase [Proteobacteria bacterium]|nr:glycerate kinase [Pseudomonadota bacterium]